MLHQIGTMKPKQSIWLNDSCLWEAELKAAESNQVRLCYSCDEEHYKLLSQEQLKDKTSFFFNHTGPVLLPLWQVLRAYTVICHFHLFLQDWSPEWEHLKTLRKPINDQSYWTCKSSINTHTQGNPRNASKDLVGFCTSSWETPLTLDIFRVPRKLWKHLH